jgi:hypothetical protein
MKAMHEDESAQVRKEAVMQLPINQNTIKFLCLKTQDENSEVRLVAYERLEK